MNITSNLAANILSYEHTDYRRFLSAHLQLLQGLCDMSKQLVVDSVYQLHTSLFITTQLLSQAAFHQRILSTIQRSRSTAPLIFEQLLRTIRSANHGNAVISAYGTNVEYIVPWDELFNVYAPTQAVFYGQCSCGLHSNCTMQASLRASNTSEPRPIPGLKMGCTPSESFLASTLQCFYEQSCIDLIVQYTHDTHSPDPLSIPSTGHFSVNSTIAELISDLFVEQWSTAINYSTYFERCAPSRCSHTYIRRFSLLHTVTFLLALQGGLGIVLSWMCPHLVQLAVRFSEWRKQRRSAVAPALRPETMHSEERSAGIVTAPLPARCSLNVLIICILLGCVLTALILFSIYFVQQGKGQVSLSTM